ncbi:MAG: efflux RND transporter periplasmic adaptor subunit [Desulfuromonadaceae bacterium]|nr:efflux RND transporter periplasmic adaptor subunit [Desulfuromonadaceae bacterium]
MKMPTGRSLRICIAILVLLILVVGGRALILKKKRDLAQAPRYQAPTTLVDTVAAYVGDLTEVHDYLAMVEPVQSVNITARVTATLKTVKVGEGDKVSAGQSLLTLDNRQTEAQLEAVLAQIKQTQADLQGNKATVTTLEESFAYWSRESERDTQLARNETIAPAQAEATVEKKNDAEGKLRTAKLKSASIEQQIRSLEARQNELKTILSYGNIQSPFQGVVTSRFVDPGDQAAPGKPLLVIESTGAMMIAFDVPQTDLPSVEAGLDVSFKVDGNVRVATISRLYPSLNRARMVRAEVVLTDEEAAGLTSGQYLTATVALQTHKDVSLIPVGALIEGGGLGNAARIFVVAEGVLSRRQVQVLGTACDQAAVEGVDSGEQVVLHSFLGWARLADGMRVSARK